MKNRLRTLGLLLVLTAVAAPAFSGCWMDFLNDALNCNGGTICSAKAELRLAACLLN